MMEGCKTKVQPTGAPAWAWRGSGCSNGEAPSSELDARGGLHDPFSALILLPVGEEGRGCGASAESA